jgi:histidinol-phosphate aminotransferase
LRLCAIAALGDSEWLAQVIARTDAAKATIADIARGHNLGAIASATNFVTIDCGRDTAYARAILNGVLERGVFIRMPGAEPLSRCIRVTAGYPADLECFRVALGETLKVLA